MERELKSLPMLGPWRLNPDSGWGAHYSPGDKSNTARGDLAIPGQSGYVEVDAFSGMRPV
ncbi:MAG: hypothetical protein QOF46_2683 [Paraburkholderia sp.]|jgi:hypothetical protein|nr:hypothetical protein [Paraburkholderia sp.]